MTMRRMVDDFLLKMQMVGKKDHKFGGVVVVIKGSKQPWDFPRP